MQSKKLFYLCAVLLGLGLQSCATLKDVVNPYDEQFHCRAKDTEGKCVDTPTAYQDARYPQPAVEDQPAPDPAKNNGKVYLFGSAISEGQPIPAPPVSAKDAAKASQYKSITDLLDNPEAPLLKPPKILRILILPYKGEKNELFMTRYAYLEVEKVSWVLTDIKEK
jgi:conjugal transfer pilus assembly protein TraV